ncbi:MAG TPA: hypothetical protein VFU37_01940, partial [Pyrinomonadaceae bacterium]|nr:hypothetical protein [Pyrinomonadaceae bacterium]
MSFWRRKKDQFVSLGLNSPAVEEPATEETPPAVQPPNTLSPVAPPTEDPIPAITPWQTSVLGLDLSIEQLQAREAALDQEFSARFRRAVSATRDSLSQRIDNVFASAKRIDA